MINDSINKTRKTLPVQARAIENDSNCGSLDRTSKANCGTIPETASLVRRVSSPRDVMMPVSPPGPDFESQIREEYNVEKMRYTTTPRGPNAAFSSRGRRQHRRGAVSTCWPTLPEMDVCPPSFIVLRSIVPSGVSASSLPVHVSIAVATEDSGEWRAEEK